MNEITIHGNVTADPTLRRWQDTGRAVLNFRVAVNRGYYDRTRNRWVDMPAVFHQVAAWGELAENAATTLRKGTAVTVTGQLSDDSYTLEGSERIINRARLDAADIAVSLRYATATVTKTARPAREVDSPHEQQQEQPQAESGQAA